jgi:hypothetical protein
METHELSDMKHIFKYCCIHSKMEELAVRLNLSIVLQFKESATFLSLFNGNLFPRASWNLVSLGAYFVCLIYTCDSTYGI